MSAPLPRPGTLGTVLAGGLARRMGGREKPRLLLAGETLLHRIARRLAPQCDGLILSANGDPARFAEWPYPVVPDPLPGYPGPLAGLLAAMDWAVAHRPDLPWIVTLPGDTPFLPLDLAARLHEARLAAGATIACAVSGGKLHPAVGLWPVSLRDDLRKALVADDVRRVRAFAERHGLAKASWPDTPIDPFFNINTPDDLAMAATMLKDLEPETEPGTALP